MFHLHYGNAIDQLASDLALRLGEPCDGTQLLTAETVLVPHAGLQRWLQLRVAEINGIAANIRFLRPGELVWELLRAAASELGQDAMPDPSPWDATQLRWHLLERFDCGSLPPALADYLRGMDNGDTTQTEDPLRRYQLANELATVFDKYQAWRRERVMGWLDGDATADWQAQLFRSLQKQLSTPPRAALIDGWLRRFASDRRPAGVPPRLFAFACLNISPDVLRMLGIVGQHVPTHFYMPTPCRAYWGDVRSERERLGQRGADAFGLDENPLLARMGRAGRDFVAQIFSYEQVQPEAETECIFEPQPEQSLLARLQADVLDRLPPATDPSDWSEPGMASDGSIVVHACHNRLREIEVLHDQLLAMLQPTTDGQAPLRPRDIAVLAPDIDAYADAIHAVFGGVAEHDPRHLPYSLADQGLLGTHPLPGLFMRLLELPGSRHPLSETLDLLALPAMQARLDIDAAAAERIGDWLHEAGVRWGRDGAARARAIDSEHEGEGGDGDDFSWRFGTDRLLLGMAIGESAQALDGCAALDRIEGAGSESLNAALRLNALIDRHSQALRLPKTPRDWQAALNHLIDDLLPTDRDDTTAQRVIEELRGAIDQCCREAATANAERPLQRETLRAALQQVIDGISPRQSLLGGGISFAGMVPLRCVPFRVIWVLGMNDGDYPRREPGGDLNRLLTELRDPTLRRIGDRSIRDDDRFLFLQLLCAAGDRFHVSHIGFDPRSGARRQPAAPVLDLLDAAGNCFADAKAARAAICLEHPLQAFAPRLFDSSDERQFSFRREWLDAAAAMRAPSQPPVAFSDAPLVKASDRADAELLTLDALLRWARLPARVFLRQSLDLYLPRVEETDVDREPLALMDPLARSQRAHALLGAWRDGQAQSSQQALDWLRARALLPAGSVGELLLRRDWQRLHPLWRQFEQWCRDNGAAPSPLRVTIDDGLSTLSIQGELSWVVPGTGGAAALIEPGRVDGRHWLAAWLQHLLRCVGGQRGDLFLYGLDENNTTPMRWRFDALDTITARTQLTSLLTLYRDSLIRPLPLLPRASARYVDGCRNPRRGQTDDGTLPQTVFESLWPDESTSRYRDGEIDDDAVLLAFRPQHFTALEYDDALAIAFREVAGAVFEPLFEAMADAETLA